MLASQLAGVFFTQCVVALDVMPAFKGAFMGLGGVGANGLQGFNIGYAQGIGDASGQVFALVVAAMGELAAM